jgi:hypothetical protein
MKLLMKSFSSAVLAASFLITSSFSANAVIIKHDILDSIGKVGEVTVELDNALLNTGLVDSAFDTGITLLDFSLGDLYSWADDLASYSFEAVIDSDNINAGIEFFASDADDVGFSAADTWAYDIIYDAFDPGFSFLDAFTSDGTIVYFDFITFGAAEISDLPVAASAPASVGVFALAMVAFFGRRKVLS